MFRRILKVFGRIVPCCRSKRGHGKGKEDGRVKVEDTKREDVVRDEDAKDVTVIGGAERAEIDNSVQEKTRRDEVTDKETSRDDVEDSEMALDEVNDKIVEMVQLESVENEETRRDDGADDETARDVTLTDWTLEGETLEDETLEDEEETSDDEATREEAERERERIVEAVRVKREISRLELALEIAKRTNSRTATELTETREMNRLLRIRLSLAKAEKEALQKSQKAALETGRNSML